VGAKPVGGDGGEAAIGDGAAAVGGVATGDLAGGAGSGAILGAGMGLCAAAVMARRATMAATTAKRAILLVLVVDARFAKLRRRKGSEQRQATDGVVLWLCGLCMEAPGDLSCDRAVNWDGAGGVWFLLPEKHVLQRSRAASRDAREQHGRCHAALA
jgi:hypothetical protein